MKAFLRRLVATVVLVVLTVTFCFQDVALAIGGEGDAESRTVAAHQRHESGETGSSTWRFPDLFWRPRPGRPVIPQADKIGGAALRDRDRPTGGAGGKDAGQRERNQESGHKGHGGPQDS